MLVGVSSKQHSFYPLVLVTLVLEISMETKCRRFHFTCGTNFECSKLFAIGASLAIDKSKDVLVASIRQSFLFDNLLFGILGLSPPWDISVSEFFQTRKFFYLGDFFRLSKFFVLETFPNLENFLPQKLF
jgi:hypothetical protein